ncbi:metallophosphoesterase family protein [Nioella aestuarii]|uniref:metallophosphoesterase family protein n=1 Tax=Nioella aestuarii TaxID=1662864 RepID=UPI003D7F5F29
MRLYAIGDVHGHPDLLRHALDRIEADRAQAGDHTAPVVQIGDLVDRGPDSRSVVQALMDLTERDARVTVLKGNHDNMFARFLETPPQIDPRLRADLTWLHPRLGGLDTLASYGVDPDQPVEQLHAEALRAVQKAHREFLNSLPLSVMHGDCLLVHAGIRPGIAIAQQDPSDLYWIRHEFLDDPRDHGPLVVHGHTPVERVEHHGNRLAIDTGAAYGGPLSAVVIEGRQVFLLTPDGRQELRPDAPA